MTARLQQWGSDERQTGRCRLSFFFFSMTKMNRMITNLKNSSNSSSVTAPSASEPRYNSQVADVVSKPLRSSSRLDNTMTATIKTTKKTNYEQIFDLLLRFNATTNRKKSKRSYIQPRKTESQNSTALQEYHRYVGPTERLVCDNAQSQHGSKWTEFLRDDRVQSH